MFNKRSALYLSLSQNDSRNGRWHLTHPILTEFVGANGGWISATLHVEALFLVVTDLRGTRR